MTAEGNKDKELKKRTYKVDAMGSLGLLALGHVGLEQWRKAKKEAKQAEQQKKDS